MTILEIVLMLFVFAALFVLFVVLHPAERCSEDCGMCSSGSCRVERGRS